jgi:hypothetical protein
MPIITVIDAAAVPLTISDNIKIILRTARLPTKYGGHNSTHACNFTHLISLQTMLALHILPQRAMHA